MPRSDETKTYGVEGRPAAKVSLGVVMGGLGAQLEADLLCEQTAVLRRLCSPQELSASCARELSANCAAVGQEKPKEEDVKTETSLVQGAWSLVARRFLAPFLAD